MMKKNILFMAINMNIGGTEKALLNMISEIPKDQYDITIYLLEKYGGFLNSIPSNVHVEYFNRYKDIKGQLNHPPKSTALNFLIKGRLIKAFFIIILHLISKITQNRDIFFKYMLYNYPKLNKEYDIAVAYDGPMDFISYFVLHKIKAKKKIQWIHFDITKIGFNSHYASILYKKFDKVFVVSNEGKNKLISQVPNLVDKTEVFSNLISTNLINKKAKEGNGFIDKFEGLKIVTVGRLSYEKGQDVAIQVLAKLIDSGFKVRWYCIGEGNLRNNYERLIEEKNLVEQFILLGSNPNPYPYLKECDIYVQTSRHEGYCIALAEARCLNKPIVTTNFTGANEQIKNGKTGLIVTLDENEIYKAIVKLITNNELREKFSYNLSLDTFHSEEELKKLYSIIY